MPQLEKVIASGPPDKLKGAAENFERIRRRIGPFMPIRVDTPIPQGSDWKSSDVHAELVLDNRK